MLQRALTLAALFSLMGVTACKDFDSITLFEGEPDAPRRLDGWYHDRAVYLTWELGSGWNGDSFRVYGKRVSDPDWYFLAEVTNCVDGACSYTDINLTAGVSYDYFVTAVDPDSGQESEGTVAVRVYVPVPSPPPSPGWTDALALDRAVYVRWDPSPSESGDFSHFRVYLMDPEGGADFLLGETDSFGFLDDRVVNGFGYVYRVSAVDDQGHEGSVGPASEAVPRPDFHGERIWAYQDYPAFSGFRFQESDGTDPLVDGSDPDRHFRFEVDGAGWWISPGPGAALHEDAFVTTALRCGPGADADCVELTVAPGTGYGSFDLELIPQTTYVLRVTGDDGQIRYGAVRVELLGTDQDGAPLMIFDWSFQLAPGVRALSPGAEPALSPEVREAVVRD